MLLVAQNLSETEVFTRGTVQIGDKAVPVGICVLPAGKARLDTGGEGERLHITERAYSDLERGVYCFSTVPLVSLLLMLKSDEFEEFIEPLRGEIAKLETGEVA